MRELLFLFRYLLRYKWSIILGFLFMLSQNYFLSLIPKYFNNIIEELQANNSYEVIINYIWISFLYTAIVFFSMFFMRVCIIGASRYVEYDLRQDLFNKLMKVNSRFYQKTQTGDLISRCTNDLNDVRTLLGPGIMYIPNSISRLIFFVPILYEISSKILIVIVTMVFVIITLILFILPKLRPLFKKVQVIKAEINNKVWESIVGIDSFRLYVREKNISQIFNALSQRYMNANLSITKIKASAWPFFIFLIGVTQLLVMYMGGEEVINGKLSIGDLFQFSMMVAQLTFPILSLGWVMTIMQQGISALGRLNKIFNEENEEKGKIIKSLNLGFSIKNLKFKYNEGKKPILMIDRLDIPFNKFIGITGNVGSGKTTLINLLSRTLKSNRGEILFGENDILDVDIVEYRKNIALCSQESFLFSKSILENVGLSEIDNIDRDRVVDALKLAALYEDIKLMKDGLNVVVGERGLKVSGGQSQRMSIARALYSQRNIILLDDTLSAVDSHIEQTIIDNLKKLKGNKTLIMVSNRISTLKLCDEIVVLNNGKLVEKGTHDDLLKNQSFYFNLYNLQQLKGI